MREGAEATITLDVFGPRGAFVSRTTLGGDAPISLSIGSTSNVELHGPGILPTHGHVAFIGSTFYAASASDSEPLIADGVPVPRAWSALAVPVTLVLGEAFVHVNHAAREAEEPFTTKTAKLPTFQKLPATLKDPWAIIARAPNAAALRVPVAPQATSSLIPVSMTQAVGEDEPVEIPLRSRIGIVLAAALLSTLVIAGYEAHARWSRSPPALASVSAASEPPPVVATESAPPPSEASSARPNTRPETPPIGSSKKPMRKRRP